MTLKGYSILLPLTEHEAFDFVAYKDERFFRVQAKYRTIYNGCVAVRLSTSWADRHGVHVQPINRDHLELIGIYCPETSNCYYVNPKPLSIGVVTLRIKPTRNKQTKGIWWADDFRDIPESVRGVPGGLALPLVVPAAVRQSSEPGALRWFC
jgi:hypothetical protein